MTRLDVIGKFIAYFSIFSAVLLLLFLPGLVAGSGGTTIALLYGQTLLLAGAFLALGLAAGRLAHDRAQALIAGVSAWLLLLFGIDLTALFAARWELVQKFPDLWVSLLIAEPLDSFRIEALFASNKSQPKRPTKHRSPAGGSPRQSLVQRDCNMLVRRVRRFSRLASKPLGRVTLTCASPMN